MQKQQVERNKHLQIPSNTYTVFLPVVSEVLPNRSSKKVKAVRNCFTSPNTWPTTSKNADLKKTTVFHVDFFRDIKSKAFVTKPQTVIHKHVKILNSSHPGTVGWKRSSYQSAKANVPRRRGLRNGHFST